MSERSRYVLISLLAVYMETVQSQNELNIAVTNPVRLGQDDLRITCSASGSYTSITSYSIFRNDSSPTLKALVTRTYNVISQSITTTWPFDDHNVQGRAVLYGNPLPFPNSTFILTIPKDEVISPEDSGGFQCQFSATVSSGAQAPVPTSTQEFIEIDRIVKSQNQLNIAVTSPVRQGQDDLRITCSASGSYSSISSYSIFRNDSSSTWKPLVTRTYNVISQTITTTWPYDNQNVQGRAVLSGSPLPFPNASFVLKIPRGDISCPGDAGGYQCQFSATVAPGFQPPDPTSNQEFVEIQTNPSQMNPMTVLANTGSGNVPVTNYRFSVGTVLTLSCTGTVGNPIQAPRWCHRKTRDFGWQSPASGVSTDGAVLVGCQNSQTTTYIHNVTSDDNDRMFLCEAGSNPQCGFGDISSTITMYLVSSATETNIDKGRENDTPLVQLKGNIMFGIGLTLFLLALAMFTAVFILYKKKSKGKRNDTYETAMPTNPQVRSEDHNYSTLGAQENYVTVN